MDGEHNPVRDGLSIGLRELSTRLRILHLYRVRITPALFWPGDDEQRADSPAWPSLEDIKVWYSELEACGMSKFEHRECQRRMTEPIARRLVC